MDKRIETRTATFKERVDGYLLEVSVAYDVEYTTHTPANPLDCEPWTDTLLVSHEIADGIILEGDPSYGDLHYTDLLTPEQLARLDKAVEAAIQFII